MDLVMVFRICFVVGLVAIPILYLLFGRGATGGNRNRIRNEDEHAQRERRSGEHGGSAEVSE